MRSRPIRPRWSRICPPSFLKRITAARCPRDTSIRLPHRRSPRPMIRGWMSCAALWPSGLRSSTDRGVGHGNRCSAAPRLAFIAGSCHASLAARRWVDWLGATLIYCASYLRLSAACLTTTFILTQFTSACRRVVDSGNSSGRARGSGCPACWTARSFATVGISHLTTSRRHLAKPVLSADGDVRRIHSRRL